MQIRHYVKNWIFVMVSIIYQQLQCFEVFREEKLEADEINKEHFVFGVQKC